MSSLAVGCGLDLDLELGIWFAGLFSAPELAAAELLLQLSVLGEAEAKAGPTKSSRCSASSCSEGPSVEVEERTVEEIPSSASTELDRRARKRYRVLSELYAGTIPAKSDVAGKKKKRRRKTHRDHGGSSSEP
ncbi:hypothetical protein D1007_43007 [Hordeum vulgare]|uniref:Uncharacterized protein n=1 Tax=Hordeum vulgare subsp. vulgare TaxID=112509 RepID=A0A8I6YKD7_HORVV|nr:hypothetical protein D1007_43007 [Hordeum vulgare]